jgi:glycosyltransferase involved in cell wall biosynthesis
MQSIKRKTFANLPVTLVTPSRHLTQAVERSGVFARAEIHTIPYGVDTHTFHPGRAEARKELGIEPARPTVLLAAQGLTDPRKGVELAVEALRHVNVRGLTVLLAGGGNVEPITQAFSMHEVRSLGYLTDPAAVARCQAAADLFIFPSLSENYPCAVQEAMACGTPVLAFDIDGVNEQIMPDQTGFLIQRRDTLALTRVAGALLSNIPRLASAGEAARHHAEKNWNLDLFISRHELLYHGILRRGPRAHASSDTISTRSPKT